MAERLRRWTANPLGSARVGSNPILVDLFLWVLFFCTFKHVLNEVIFIILNLIMAHITLRFKDALTSSGR